MGRRSDKDIYSKDAPKVNATRVSDESLVLGFGPNGEFVAKAQRELERRSVGGSLPQSIPVQDTRRVREHLAWEAASKRFGACLAALEAGSEPGVRSRSVTVTEPPVARSPREMITPLVGPVVLGIGIPDVTTAVQPNSIELGTIKMVLPPVEISAITQGAAQAA